MSVKRLQNNKGFTLVELLVSMAIISVLAAIIIGGMSNARQKSRDAKRVSDVANIQLALQLYFDRCGQYPAHTGNIPNIDAANGCPSGITLKTFIDHIPVPPQGNTYTTYLYIVKTDYSDFYIGSMLEAYNHVLADDIDGQVGSSVSGWSGFGSGTFFAGATDTTDRLFALTSK